MPGSVVDSMVSGASSAVGRTLLNEFWKFLFNAADLSLPAQAAIQAMDKEYFSETTLPNFIKPLLRTGFYFGKEPFAKTELCEYLVARLEKSTQQVPKIINKNLQEAAQLLLELQGNLTSHIIARRINFGRADKDHSFILLYLLECIALTLEEIGNNPELLDADVERLIKKIQHGIVKPYHVYVEATQSKQGQGARRTTVNYWTKECADKVKKAFDRYVIQKPLDTSIKALNQAAQKFNNEIKRMLLAVALIAKDEGEKQQDPVWVSKRKAFLSTLIYREKDLLPYLQKAEMNSVGYSGTQGVLFTNPFFGRVKELIKPVATQEQCYFQLLISVLTQQGQLSRDGQETPHLDKFKEQYVSYPPSSTFLLNALQPNSEKALVFIEAAIALFRQSNQLAVFMGALNQFMCMVGKIGLYNNMNLHTQLNGLIQAVASQFQSNLDTMFSNVLVQDQALVGAWLNPIDSMLRELKENGDNIVREMGTFRRLFDKIMDPQAMRDEFNACKQLLWQAALGLGYASAIKSEQMEAISNEIGAMSLENFIPPPPEYPSNQVGLLAETVVASAPEFTEEEKTAPIRVKIKSINNGKVVKELEDLDQKCCNDFEAIDNLYAAAQKLSTESSLEALIRMLERLAQAKGGLKERMTTYNELLKQTTEMAHDDKMLGAMVMKITMLIEVMVQLHQFIDEKRKQFNDDQQRLSVLNAQMQQFQYKEEVDMSGKRYAEVEQMEIKYAQAPGLFESKLRNAIKLMVWHKIKELLSEPDSKWRTKDNIACVVQEAIKQLKEKYDLLSSSSIKELPRNEQEAASL